MPIPGKEEEGGQGPEECRPGGKAGGLEARPFPGGVDQEAGFPGVQVEPALAALPPPLVEEAPPPVQGYPLAVGLQEEVGNRPPAQVGQKDGQVAPLKGEEHLRRYPAVEGQALAGEVQGGPPFGGADFGKEEDALPHPQAEGIGLEGKAHLKDTPLGGNHLGLKSFGPGGQGLPHLPGRGEVLQGRDGGFVHGYQGRRKNQ